MTTPHPISIKDIAEHARRHPAAAGGGLWTYERPGKDPRLVALREHHGRLQVRQPMSDTWIGFEPDGDAVLVPRDRHGDRVEGELAAVRLAAIRDAADVAHLDPRAGASEWEMLESIRVLVDSYQYGITRLEDRSQRFGRLLEDAASLPCENAAIWALQDRLPPDILPEHPAEGDVSCHSQCAACDIRTRAIDILHVKKMKVSHD